jgi:hypothetical protein
MCSAERNQYGQRQKTEISTYSSDTFHPTVPAVVRHHIPIAEPNFPRVAVPFAIAVWVLGVCIVKTGIKSHFLSLYFR